MDYQEAMTAKEEEIMKKIKSFYDREGFYPSRTQTARMTGFFNNNIYDRASMDFHVRNLIKKGRLESNQYAGRGSGELIIK